jgi:hypothetical protein
VGSGEGNFSVRRLKKMGISVKRCGFFVDKDFPYLGASPDGPVDHGHVVEIKCPSSARYFKTIKDAVIAKQMQSMESC